MLPLFLTVIARLLCNSLQSSMATPVVIFRSRLLSGLGQFRVLLAAVDILANDRDTKLSV